MNEDELFECRNFLKRVMDEEEFEEIISGLDTNCRRCGNCCKHIFWENDKIHISLEKGQRCRHLTEGNLCGIYDKRPQDCKNFLDPRIWDFEYFVNHSFHLNWKAEICPVLMDFWNEVNRIRTGGVI